jgi:glucose-6-phosphate 1-epimerase
VCWPWFGPHPGDPAKPAHGFVRTRDWRVVASDRDADAARLRLAIATEKRDRALWPHAASLELEVALGDGLSLALATRNGGGAPFPLTSALHTYFRVAEIARAFVEGLDGRTYIDKLDCLARKVQSGAVTIDREVDRIYLGDTRAITLVDGTTGDRIAITSRGSASAVVWNPWIDKTARLGDMGAADAFRGMLCIETANAGDDVIALEPGATHVLGASYSVG